MIGAQTGTAGAYAAFQRQIGQGYDLLKQGRLDDARHLSERLLAAHADNAEALYLAGEVQLEAGDADAALALISRAVEVAPGQFALLLKKARILNLLRRRSEAKQVAGEAAAVAANNGRALWAVGSVHGRCGDPATERRFYERARAAGVQDPALLYDLATAQFFTGDFAAAEENLDALLADAPGTGHALYLRSTLRRQTEANNHVAELQARLDAGVLDDTGRAACLYALAKELEDLGKAEESFSALSEGAALKRRTLSHDAVAEREAIAAIAGTWSAESMKAPVEGHDEAGAIFVVGMPRTGTTLVERMLGRHSEVGSAGELLDFGQLLMAAVQKVRASDPAKTPAQASRLIDFAALGRDYMASARQAAAGSPVFVDKMPINFMYCGLIRKALPNARIVHLVRDPLDTCYAVYKTLFNQAYPFSYAQDELGAYYATYHRLMQHWHAVMPGDIVDVHYEDLVADVEGQARRILAHCGLDWQDAVLASTSDHDAPSMTASAAQVREPVHSRSVGKWRNHEAGLAPLVASLAAARLIDLPSG
ncbi:tetratricopeptide repeat-containing sulfotransferase family protein [Novilysobacter erysipheiresistens]|uniref:Sulfotransferase n=1 Tax=Novilysobacter erysipheiresistens TaxID=1749332 RepID=A0ABU7Z1S2_9GAMM